jgi:ADP-ribosylglycohydrolase
MKAWQRARHLLENAEPTVRTEEEQPWDAGDQLRALDFDTRQFWQSNVPGSGAPECLMVAALQSLENKGFVLADYDPLVGRGLEAVERDDMETLLKVDMELRAVLRAATPDPAHPSQLTVRFADWQSFDASVQWPQDDAFDVESDAFADRIRGGWRAQLIGGAVGTALEGYTAEKLQARFGEIDGYVRPPNTYNDDITYELAFLEAFGEHGYAVTSRDIAGQWTALVPVGWSAETVALANLRQGILPPASGSEGNPFDEWIGAQMRGTVCGMVAPGRPREAGRLAWLDAEISHAGNGILGEVFNAVLASLAFRRNDSRQLVTEVVELIPPDTEYGRVVRQALQACRQSDGWREAWRVCDASLVEYNWIHAYPNAAAQVISLWFGAGDFDRTLSIVAGIGHDADCNAAQMLCVLGLMGGSSVIPSRWLGPLGEDLVTYMRRPARMKIEDLVLQTVDVVRHAQRSR